MKRQFKPVAFLFYALILVIFFASLSTLLQPPGPPEIKNYSQVVSFFEEEQVKSFTIHDGVLTMQLYQPYEGSEKVQHGLGSLSIFYNDLRD